MISFMKRHRLAAAAALAGLAALLLYWPTLRLPIIYDSLLHIRITKSLDFGTVWLPTEAFGFYRPLTFLPLLIIQRLWGFYPNWLLHGLNVAQHGLNAALLVALTWRLGARPWQALVTGLLFALFPFSYQAVAVYGHNVHPTTAGLILLGLHTYLTAKQKAESGIHNSQFAIRNSQFLWWSITAVLFLLSLLSHESGVLFGVFAGLVQFTRAKSVIRHPKSVFRNLPPSLVFLALGAVYAVSYQFLPISRAPQAAGGASENAWLRGLYLLQAAAYPLTWFAHKLPQIGANSLVWGAALITAAWSAWTARLSAARRPLLLGWGWWGAASLLIAVPLPTGYLLHGPRLLYLGSVGASLAWGVMLTGNSQRLMINKKQFVANGFLAGFLAFVLVTNWQFVRGRLADYERLTEPVQVMKDVMAERPSEGIVVVNLPQWLSPPRNTYAVGAELAAMLGNYLFANELIGENVAGEHAVYPVAIADLNEGTPYHVGLHDETAFRGEAAATLPIAADWTAAGSQVFIVRYAESGPQTVHAGAFQPADAGPAQATLGFYTLYRARTSACDGTVQVTLTWGLPANEPVPGTTSVFVQLFSADGRFLAQADGPPLGLRPDLVQFSPDWELVERRTMPVTVEDQPARLLVGVYDYTTGERLPAIDNQQTPLKDNALPLPVAQCRQ